jgi:hypothetical protein
LRPVFRGARARIDRCRAARVSVGAATNFTAFFDAKSLADWETKLRFMEAQVAWFEYFFGPFNKGQLDQMRTVVARLKAAQRG